jgi:hypothetical protein
VGHTPGLVVVLVEACIEELPELVEHREQLSLVEPKLVELTQVEPTLEEPTLEEPTLEE